MQSNKVDILLVEDNPYEAKLTIAGLKKHDLTNHLFHVEDGDEALNFIFARGEFAHRQNELQPKVILLDLNLPKIGGLEVLRQIKSADMTKSIPVIILTSSQEDKDIKVGYENGANSYIVKPVEFEPFAKAVADLGLYWMFLNQQRVA
jgi:two-component system response regulator